MYLGSSRKGSAPRVGVAVFVRAGVGLMWGWDPCGRPRGGVAGVSMSVEEDGYEEARGRAKGGNGHPTPPRGRPQGSPHHSTPLPPLQRLRGSEREHTVSL